MYSKEKHFCGKIVFFFFLQAIFVPTEGGQWPMGISRRCKCPKAPTREHLYRSLISKSFSTCLFRELGNFSGNSSKIQVNSDFLAEQQRAWPSIWARLNSSTWASSIFRLIIDEPISKNSFGSITSPTLDEDDNDVIEEKLVEKVRRTFSKDCFYNRKWWWSRNRLQTRRQYKERLNIYNSDK